MVAIKIRDSNSHLPSKSDNEIIPQNFNTNIKKKMSSYFRSSKEQEEKNILALQGWMIMIRIVKLRWVDPVQ